MVYTRETHDKVNNVLLQLMDSENLQSAFEDAMLMVDIMEKVDKLNDKDLKNFFMDAYNKTIESIIE